MVVVVVVVVVGECVGVSRSVFDQLRLHVGFASDGAGGREGR